MKYFSMKNTYLSFLCSLPLFFLSCQTIKGSGNPATRELKINGVSKINLSGISELFITQANEENLIIRTDDNILPHIISSVSGAELSLGVENDISISPVTPLVFKVSVKDLSDIVVSGTNCVDINTLDTKYLNLNLSGSTSLKGKDITLEKIHIHASGSSSITLKGKADTQTLVLSDYSLFDGANLNGKSAIIDASGSSAIKLNVSDKISGSISGTTSVEYKQHPTTNLNTSDVSTIGSF